MVKLHFISTLKKNEVESDKEKDKPEEQKKISEIGSLRRELLAVKSLR